MRRLSKKLLIVVVALLVAAWARSDLTVAPRSSDTLGPLYAVTEPDLLEHIEQAAAAVDTGAVLAAAQQQAQAYADAPPPVVGLLAALKSHSRLFDPTIALAAPVIDAAGKILHPVGTTVNPLEHVKLDGRLVFIDERDVAQSRFAALQLQRPGRSRIVLVGGSPRRFAANYGASAYFDQDGFMSQRLQLREVPAVIEQEGLALRINIVALTRATQ